MSTPSPSQYRAAAYREFHDEGVCEVDDNAKINRPEGGDDGAYVQAWVWVDNDTCNHERLGDDKEPA